jgi:hypothetical protein
LGFQLLGCPSGVSSISHSTGYTIDALPFLKPDDATECFEPSETEGLDRETALRLRQWRSDVLSQQLFRSIRAALFAGVAAHFFFYSTPR